MRFFYENRLGIKKSVISLFTCFVRIPARNSVNPIIQITCFPTVTVIGWKSPFVSLGASALFCRFYSIFLCLYLYLFGFLFSLFFPCF